MALLGHHMNRWMVYALCALSPSIVIGYVFFWAYFTKYLAHVIYLVHLFLPPTVISAYVYKPEFMVTIISIISLVTVNILACLSNKLLSIYSYTVFVFNR